MPAIKIKHIVSFSSEDKNHPADNLLKDDQYRKWKCAAGEKSASVVFQLEKAEQIISVDIGNEGSSFIEVLVGRSASKEDFQVLLVASSFMSPGESKTGTNLNRVRMFSSEKLSKPAADKKWDQVKIVCTQPFNKNAQYGLSFIKFHSAPDGTSNKTPTNPATKQSTLKLGAFVVKQEDPADILGPGSLFAKQRDSGASAPLKGAAAVRAASNLAEASLQKPKVESSAERQTPPERAKPTFPRRLSNEADVAPSSRVKASTPAGNLSDTRKTSQNQQKTKGSDTTESTRKQKKSPAAAAASAEPARKTNATASLSAKKTSRPSSPPPSKRPKKDPGAGKDTPFERLMEGVVFTLSGFQNPYRSQLRDQALAMGAKYRPDWDNACTHLVCAFVNTPKFLQVRGKGGKIVSKEWIVDCHKKKKPLPWKQYRLGGTSDSEGGNTESTDENDDDDSNISLPKGVSQVKKTPVTAAPSPKKPTSSTRTPTPKKMTPSAKGAAADEDDYGGSTDVDSDRDGGGGRQAESSDTEDEIRRVQEGNTAGKLNNDGDSDEVYNADTDVEDMVDDEGPPAGKVDTSHHDLPKLPNLFRGKGFFLYGTFDAALRRLLTRYITAFDGKVEDYMGDKISFVVTESEWDDQFDEALEENPSLSFVKPRWIFTCSDKGRLVPHQPFSVMPSDPVDD